MGLESASLFDMKAPEIAAFDVLLEAFDRACGGVDGSAIAAFCVLQEQEVAPLDALIFSVAIGHVSRTLLKSTFRRAEALSSRRCSAVGNAMSSTPLIWSSWARVVAR